MNEFDITFSSEDFSFSISEHIGKGWDIFKENAGIYIGMLIVYILMAMGASCIPVVGTILIQPYMFGFYMIAQKTIENESVEFGQSFDGFNHIGKILGIYILNSFAISIVIIPLAVIFFLIGYNINNFNDFLESEWMVILLLLIVIGLIVTIYLSIAFYFATHFAIFKNLGIIDAMNASRRMVHRNFLQFFLLFVVLTGIIIAGVIFIGLGLLIALPLVYCTIQSIFNHLIINNNLKDIITPSHHLIN